MTFDNCDVDPRTGNVLMSPELTLQADEELTFTTIYPAAAKVRSLSLYQTSVIGHPFMMLGSYSPSTSASSYANSSNGTNSSSSTSDVTLNTICLPAGTYQLAFIAMEANSVANSQVALTDVSLTGVSCTYFPLSGTQ